MRIQLQYFMAIWFCCLFPDNLSGQSWFTQLDGTQFSEYATDIILSPDGGYLVAGIADEVPNSSGAGTKDLLLFKLDADGKQQWMQRLDYTVGTHSWDEYEAFLHYENDSTILVVSGIHDNTSGIDGHLLFWRLRANGEILAHEFSSPHDVHASVLSQTGEIVTAGLYFDCPIFECEDYKAVNIFDNNFQPVIDNLHFGYGLALDDIHGLVEMPDGTLCFFSEEFYWDDPADMWRSWCYLEVFNLQTGSYNKFLIDNGNGFNYFEEGMVKFDDQHVLVSYSRQNGYTIKKVNVYSGDTENYSINTHGARSRITGSARDMGYVVAGSSDTFKIFIAGSNLFGQWWEREFTIPEPMNYNGQYVWTRLTKILQTPDRGYVILGTTTIHNSDIEEIFVLKVDSNGVFGGHLEGYVRQDVNGDCIATANEPPLAGWIVEATSDNSVYHTVTDANGYYLMRLPLDAYSISFSHVNPAYWELCPNIDSAHIVDEADTVSLHQAVKQVVQCPLLDIALATGTVNICNSSTYHVSYCNYGTLATDTARVRLTLDPYMTIESASLPFTLTGNLAEFFIGEILPGDCGTIKIDIAISCNAPSGSFCISASITPALYCAAGTPPPGIVFDLLQCANAGQPFDPNSKTGQPTGTGLHHRVPDATPLIYQIHFQNTGTDTAIQVVLRDTLSAFLDITTLQAGPSSHPYRLSISGTGALCFTFDNIHLPDSNVNEPASHGFVEYQVSPVDGAPFHTPIYNTASIYFDYQPPIVTNTVFHTLAKPIRESWFDMAVCNGESFEGYTIIRDTLITDTLAYPMYDSVRHIQFEALPVFHQVMEMQICDGDSAFFNNQVLTSEGQYSQVWETQNGCDSTVVLNLVVMPNPVTSITLDLCEGDTSPYSEIIYHVTGNYIEQFAYTNQSGCDSTLIVNLHVYPHEFLIIEKELPKGSTYHGIVLTQDTVFVFADTTAQGCLLSIQEFITVTTTSVSDHHTAGVKVFPNPMEDEFNLVFQNPSTAKYHIQLLSIQGIVVEDYGHLEVPSGHYQLTLQAPESVSGLLLVQINSGKSVSQLRIVKL